MDRTVRTPYQAAAVTNAECFGIIPRSKERNPAFQVLRQPSSYMAHTLRRALAAIREQSDMRVVGVISMLPGEGKTIMAANLAQQAAASGSRVLLVDAAIYSGKLSRLLAPEATGALAKSSRKSPPSLTCCGACPVQTSNFSRLAIPGRRERTDRWFYGLEEVFSHAAFDLVIVDLPPVTVVADVREVAASFDGFVLVVEWGKTSLDIVEAALASNDQIHRKLLGVILNKVDIGKLRTYDRALSSLYDQRKYVTHLGNGEAPRFAWRRARNSEKKVKLTS